MVFADIDFDTGGNICSYYISLQFKHLAHNSIQFSSVAQSCLTIITREEINLWILDCGLSRKWSFEITFSLEKALTYPLIIYWVWEGFCITYWSNLILSYCVWVLAVVLHRAKVYCEHMLIIRMVQCTIDMILFCSYSRESTPKGFQWREEMYWWGKDELLYSLDFRVIQYGADTYASRLGDIAAVGFTGNHNTVLTSSAAKWFCSLWAGSLGS